MKNYAKQIQIQNKFLPPIVTLGKLQTLAPIHLHYFMNRSPVKRNFCYRIFDLDIKKKRISRF